MPYKGGPSDLLSFYPSSSGEYYDEGVLYFALLPDCSFSISDQNYSLFPVITQQEQGDGYITITTPGNSTAESNQQTIRLVAVPAPK